MRVGDVVQQYEHVRPVDQVEITDPRHVGRLHDGDDGHPGAQLSRRNGVPVEIGIAAVARGPGLEVDFDGAIKTTGNNTICCSDIQRMYGHGDYTLIVGVYNQVDNKKVFHTEYQFFIKKEDFDKLWGNTSVEKLNEYVNKVKSVKHGKEAQEEYQKAAESWKLDVADDNALFVINPKVDSKKQRRVQCSLHIDKLIAAGIDYTKNSIEYTVVSGRRKFN